MPRLTGMCRPLGRWRHIAVTLPEAALERPARPGRTLTPREIGQALTAVACEVGIANRKALTVPPAEVVDVSRLPSG